MQERIEHPTTSTAKKWTKRAGLAAFLFFLVKGLIWLGVAAAGAYYALY